MLVARIGSVLRRGRVDDVERTRFTVGNLSVDLESREARVQDTTLDLTRTEFDLLAALLENPKRVVPRRELVERVWGDWYGDDHMIEVHMSRMRSKVAKAGGPKVGVAVRGVGYKAGIDS